MAVNGVGDFSPVDTQKQLDKKRNTSGQLTMDDFYTLMAVQLQNQDMSNPMDNSEMMNQMVQMAMVSAMSTFTDYSVTQYALGMMGKQVQVFDIVDGKEVIKEGIISGVSLSGGVSIFLEGDDTSYGLGNIMSVGDVPKKEEEDGEGDGDGDKKPEGPGGEGGGDKEPGASDPATANGAGSPADGAKAGAAVNNKPGPDEAKPLEQPYKK